MQSVSNSSHRYFKDRISITRVALLHKPQTELVKTIWLTLFFMHPIFDQVFTSIVGLRGKNGAREKGRGRTTDEREPKKWWKMRGKRQRKKSSGAALVPELYCFPQKILRERIHLAFRLMNLHQTLPGKALWKIRKKQNNSTIISLLPSIFFREAHTHTHTANDQLHLVSFSPAPFSPLLLAHAENPA